MRNTHTNHPSSAPSSTPSLLWLGGVDPDWDDIEEDAEDLDDDFDHWGDRDPDPADRDAAARAERAEAFWQQ